PGGRPKGRNPRAVHAPLRGLPRHAAHVLGLCAGAIRPGRSRGFDGLPRRAGLQGREGRHGGAACDGQPDLPPRNPRDDRRIHQPWPEARPAGAHAAELGDRDTNRPTEYNSLDDKYARVITEELMPALSKEYNISKDPEMHGIGGSSSGAIAAFTV